MTRTDGISVIICCYNSERRIVKTLSHLFNQRFTHSLQWEIIIVDNCSTDNTRSTSLSLYNESDCNVPFKVVDENQPGLSHARKRGFDSSMHEFVLMVDDDNWLCEDYVQRIYDDLKSNPSAAMVGGLGIAEPEGAEPFWFKDVASCFATGPQSAVGQGPLHPASELYGAGCGIRMSCWEYLESNGFQSLLADRTGKSLISGGDVEMCLAFRLAGFDLLYDSRISFQHFLPESRLNWDYLKKLFIGFGMSKPRADIYVACLEDRPIPDQGRLPLWLDRMLFLSKEFLWDIPHILKSYLVNSEGDIDLLYRFGRFGHLKALFQLKSEYKELFNGVYSLNQRLQNGQKK